MTFLQRLSYFGGGAAIGTIILIVFLSGKKTSCDYSPQARVLKNIGLKEFVFTETTLAQLKSKQLDTSIVSKLLKNGTVVFSKSNTKLDSCKIYFIEGTIQNKEIELLIENCNKQAKITSFKAKN